MGGGDIDKKLFTKQQKTDMISPKFYFILFFSVAGLRTCKGEGVPDKPSSVLKGHFPQVFSFLFVFKVLRTVRSFSLQELSGDNERGGRCLKQVKDMVEEDRRSSQESK